MVCEGQKIIDYDPEYSFRQKDMLSPDRFYTHWSPLYVIFFHIGFLRHHLYIKYPRKEFLVRVALVSNQEGS